MEGSSVTTLFKSIDQETWTCDSANLIKLNKFSKNQLIVIRGDALKEVAKMFASKSEDVIL